jgi:hypothetical protein
LTEPADTEYLYEPPDSSGRVPPSVITALQLLPLASLGWDNFERLCLRLAEREADVEYAGLYGVRGQNQQGIDVLVRFSDGGHRLIQCRRLRRSRLRRSPTPSTTSSRASGRTRRAS